MKIVTSWLREFVEIPASDHELAEKLTLAGLAIDGVETAANGESVLEADIGTNRPDAMNHYGLAREAATIFDRDLKPIRPTFQESSKAASDVASVEILDADLCPRYTARVIMGVKVGPSPEWMVRRLEAAGQRSINNVADVTNYLMLENGHPLHSFDLDQVAGRKIIVRRARAGETMETLDGIERKFTPDHLLICDGEKPVGIGGVMGGQNSGISDRTVNVLLEAAWFEPKSIRKTARHFGMHTDASHRFERGMDLNFTGTATDRAAELIQKVAGGEILKGRLDAYPNPQPRAVIELRRKELDRIIGVQVPAAEVLRILRRLGFMPDELGYGNWKMIPPSWRLDVTREIDIVEEVGRPYGFERLPDSLCSWAGGVHRPPHAAMERVLRDTARALGYDETIAISLVPEAKTRRFSSEEPAAIGNPLSAESAVLRTSPLPGVLDAVLWNLNHGEAESRVFEVGKIYRHAGNAYEEPPTLGIALAPGDFLHLKGDIETVLDQFECAVSFDSAVGVDYFHPGRSARMISGGETLGRFGELHPRVASEYGFRQPVWAAEFFLDPLYRAGLRVPKHRDLPRFPAVDRDLSLIVPDSVTFQSLHRQVHGAGIVNLREIIAVGDPFRGEQVPQGHYSLLLRFRFQSSERTLSDKEVNDEAVAIVMALRPLGVTLRLESR